MASKIDAHISYTKARRRNKPVGRKHSKKIGRRSTIVRKRGLQ